MSSTVPSASAFRPAPFRVAPRVHRSAGLIFTVAALAFIAAVLNGVGIAGFPRDEVMERIVAIGITVDLVAVAAVLIVIGTISVLADRARPDDEVVDASTLVIRGDGTEVTEPAPRRITVAALLGTVFGAVAWALWLVLSGSAIIFALLTDRPVSYLDGAAGGFVFGLLWVLATVFGAAGRHRGGDARNLKFSAAATTLGVALMVPLVTLSMLHGAGVIG